MILGIDKEADSSRDLFRPLDHDKRAGDQHVANALFLERSGNGEATETHCRNVFWELLGQRLWKGVAVNLAERQCEKSGDAPPVLSQDISPGNTLEIMLAGDLREVAVECIDTAIEAFPVVLFPKRFEIKHGPWP